MTNLVKIEPVVSFDGKRKVIRISAYAVGAPAVCLCTAEMDADTPIDRDYLEDVIDDFRNGRFPE